MKIRWIEYYKKPCWEIKTPLSLPLARFQNEDDIPDLIEYKTERLEGGNLFIEREREGFISTWEILKYWFLGYREIIDVVSHKYKTHVIKIL